MLLTGHADKQSAIQAINDVGLFQYLEKPWDNSQLLLVIQSAIERTQLFRSLREKISELDTAHSSLKDVQSRLVTSVSYERSPVQRTAARAEPHLHQARRHGRNLAGGRAACAERQLCASSVTGPWTN